MNAPLTLAWPKAGLPQQISPNQVHVWAWTLEGDEGDPADEVYLLDPEERSRFRRFHFDRDRSRFAKAHANMRRILGAYLSQLPDSIRFRANRYGKPELFVNTRSHPLRFNLSHSQRLALLALALDIEVGVDAEELRPIEPDVAEHHFSPAELSALASLQGEEWLAGFYRCWTRKEAILKAEGVGLNIPLDAFDVSLLPRASAELLGSRPEANFQHAWRLYDLSPAAGIAAALATGMPVEVNCFSF